MNEHLTCGAGGGSCPNPAVERLCGNGPWACEGHIKVIALGEDEDDLQSGLHYLNRWDRTVDRYGVECLRKPLRTLREELTAELAEVEAKQCEVIERYSLPPSRLELLRDKELEEPESQGEKRWQEADKRASRFTAAAVALEEEIDKLHARLEEEVLPLLEEEAKLAEEEAERVKEGGL